MFTYPDIDPVAFSFWKITVHWYGVTYLVAFLVGWWLASRRARKSGSGWQAEEIGDVVFYIVLGVIIGGKLGHMLFYQHAHFLSDPLAVLNPFGPDGWRGMSFHGDSSAYW